MKFIKRLIKAYKLVRQEELTIDYSIEEAKAIEVKEISMEEAGKLAREREADAIKAIQDYEEYR